MKGPKKIFMRTNDPASSAAYVMPERRDETDEEYINAEEVKELIIGVEKINEYYLEKADKYKKMWKVLKKRIKLDEYKLNARGFVLQRMDEIEKEFLNAK